MSFARTAIPKSYFSWPRFTEATLPRAASLSFPLASSAQCRPLSSAQTSADQKNRMGRRPPRRTAANRPEAAAGPAKYSGAMGGFSVQNDDAGKKRFQAFGPDGAPLTAPLTDLNFCVWAITSQFPYIDSVAAHSMHVAVQCAGLALAMEDATALVLRNAPRPLHWRARHQFDSVASFSAGEGTPCVGYFQAT